MCGICGVIGADDQERLMPMLRRLVHRGPDEEGIHREPGVALGARRLRVIDPMGSRQPVYNETRTVWAVLNGEIYNYRELRKELVARGHRFMSDGDAEVVVHLYEEGGPSAFERLRGMFALALWDRAQEAGYLARDRFGIKPLYYSVIGAHAGTRTHVAFSSELPSLLSAVPAWRICRSAVADYLTCLYVPGPETIVEGVFHVRPGEWIRVSGGALEFGRYYDIRRHVPVERGTTLVSHEEMWGVLRSALAAHLVSDVPLGLLLSGGLDSAALLALMHRVGSRPLKTFTVGYEHAADRSFNELANARRIARLFGAEHQEAILDPDVRALLPRVVEAMGEPFGDSSAMPTYLISEVAKRSVTVALSGIGGDELFGGYPRHLGIRAAAVYQRVPVTVRRAVGAIANRWLRDTGSGRDYAGRLRRFLCEATQPLAAQYRRWTSAIPPEWEHRLWSPDVAATLPWDRLGARFEALFERWPSFDPSDRAMGMDLQSYLPDDLLRLGDRMSMAHALELRVPFCDHLVVEAALRIPACARFGRERRLKGFMRAMLRDVLPPDILHAPKQGFMVPLARWLREDLREMVGDLLTDDTVRRRDYVKPAYVHWLRQQHNSGLRNCADQLYALMVLELWHRSIESRVMSPVQEAVV